MAGRYNKPNGETFLPLKTYIICIVYCGMFICLHLGISRVEAAGEFTADYDIRYDISAAGTTTVEQQIRLTNNFTNLYARQYAITIDSDALTQIGVQSKDGAAIPHKTEISDGKTTLTVTFPTPVVGVGNAQEFILTYIHNKLYEQNGNIRQFEVPGLTQDQNLGSYQASLHVPDAFGYPSYISPQPLYDLTWTKNELTEAGAMVAFGDEQVYDITLTYHLDNPSPRPVYTEIALPPDTAYQRIIILSIDPQPTGVRRDGDGNWLARYDLAPRESVDVTVQIGVSIVLEPRDEFITVTDAAKSYLEPTQHWQSHAREIQQLADEYTTAEEIYAYVSETLSYDFDSISYENPPIRKGALGALNDPNHAVCMEFTDLFIAIARAAGIPARQLVGYAHTDNSRLRPLSLVQDVLHAWPEYYDTTQGTWIPVDPTWSNTTGGFDYFSSRDFNHVVFAINGERDDFPYPAGTYRNNENITKDITVKFGSDLLLLAAQKPQDITLDIDAPVYAVAGIPLSGSVTLTNNNSTSVNNVQLRVYGSPITLEGEEKIPQVPPYGTVIVPFTATNNEYFWLGTGIINAQVEGKRVEQPVTLWPIFILLIPVVALGILTGGSVMFWRRLHHEINKAK